MRIWCEIQDVKPGDTLVIRMASFEVTKVEVKGRNISLTGFGEDSKVKIYVGVSGELVQRDERNQN